MRSLSRLAAAALVAAASAFAAAPKIHPPPDSPDPLGWTNGKQCSIANGCEFKPTVAACLDCCEFYCPGGTLELECIDTCLPDEPDAIRQVRRAAAGIRDGNWSRENIGTMLGAQASSRPRVRAVAMSLSNESELRALLDRRADQGRVTPFVDSPQGHS